MINVIRVLYCPAVLLGRIAWLTAVDFIQQPLVVVFHLRMTGTRVF
ncbi:hypothetical protein AABH07_004843 [Salmonella enterica]|nr:hypothetical protein [Salmonella enterica]EIE5455110.1 hypothetical protein [Salmonella enterica]EKR4279286.1 hypothetical protein [Salmonella enterica]